MHSKAILITTLLVLVGCSSSPKQQSEPGASKRQPEPSAFAVVRTIELRDSTDPVLLASTGAKRVREYLEVGLTHRGYTVCRDCKSDAVATVTVRVYRTKQDSKRDWAGWGNLSYLEYGESDWTLTIVRNDETIYEKRIKHNKTMPIDQLAAQQVLDVLRKIPTRQ
jgi:hypothetical protein